MNAACVLRDPAGTCQQIKTKSKSQVYACVLHDAFTKSTLFKGALCSFGVEILIRREKSSLTDILTIFTAG